MSAVWNIFQSIVRFISESNLVIMLENSQSLFFSETSIWKRYVKFCDNRKSNISWRWSALVLSWFTRLKPITEFWVVIVNSSGPQFLRSFFFLNDDRNRESKKYSIAFFVFGVYCLVKSVFLPIFVVEYFIMQ